MPHGPSKWHTYWNQLLWHIPTSTFSWCNAFFYLKNWRLFSIKLLVSSCEPMNFVWTHIRWSTKSVLFRHYCFFCREALYIGLADLRLHSEGYFNRECRILSCLLWIYCSQSFRFNYLHSWDIWKNKFVRKLVLYFSPSFLRLRKFTVSKSDEMLT